MRGMERCSGKDKQSQDRRANWKISRKVGTEPLRRNLLTSHKSSLIGGVGAVRPCHFENRQEHIPAQIRASDADGAVRQA